MKAMNSVRFELLIDDSNTTNISNDYQIKRFVFFYIEKSFLYSSADK